MFLPLTTSERLARRPVLVGALIVGCVIMFGLTSAMKKAAGSFVLAFAFTTVDRGWGLFTYAFLHADVMHLAGNMFFLWTFGRLVEARWGHVLMGLCFAIAGAAGAMLHGLAHRGGPVAPLIGASGAIAGLAGAVVVALPNARFNRLFSPLLWPAMPIVALSRGRGIKALLELFPFYGWVLKLDRGLPAFFVLPAWLSLDLFQMVLEPEGRTSFACHVGGAFAGMAFAALMRATKLPEQMRRLAGRAAEVEGTDSEEGLSPALRALRAANRPSRFPEGRRSGVWFVLSLVAAAGLMAASFRLGSAATAYRDKRQGDALRTKLMASKDASGDPFDQRYEHVLFTVSFPKAFQACGKGRAEAGPCAGHKSIDDPNVGAIELVHPDAMETVVIMAVKYGVDKRSELVAAVADGVTKETSDAGEKWRLVDTKAGTCHGEYSVESVIEIGSGEQMQRMYSCTFSKELDLFLYAYIVPDVLRERDEKMLGKILDEVELAVAAAPVAATRPGSVSLGDAVPTSTSAAKAPPPGGDDAPTAKAELTSCANGQLAYHVDGKLQCYQPLGDGNSRVGSPARRPSLPKPRRR